MAKLDLIIGPMFAGKSSELMRRIRLLKVLNKQYLVAKPFIDSRYSNEHIVSHNLEKEKCTNFNSINEIVAYPLNNIDTIFIDEAQFFTDIKKPIIELVDKFNINVVLCGLNGDSDRNLFGELHELIPLCDNIIKINALCKICLDGTPGIFSHRLADNNQQVLVGAENQFICVCRKHYLELNS
jgi:thymidine kinase